MHVDLPYNKVTSQMVITSLKFLWSLIYNSKQPLNPESRMSIPGTFYIITVPSPSVTLTAISSEPHVVGDTLSLRCQATVSHHINTLVTVDFTWTKSSTPLSGSSDSRVTVSETAAVNSQTYRTTLTVSGLSIREDSNLNYTCQAVVRSEPASSYILSSTSALSDAYLLNVHGMHWL